VDPQPVRARFASSYTTRVDSTFFAGQLEGSGGLREVSEAARGAPGSSGAPGLSDLLLDGLSLLITEGLAAAAPTLRKAVGAFEDEELSVERSLHLGLMAGAAAATLWDFEGIRAVTTRQTDLARSAGALAPLCLILQGGIHNSARCGDLAMAAVLSAERDALANAIELRQAPLSDLLVAALKGDEPHSSRFIEAATDLARAQGEGTAAQVGLWANALLSNGLAHYERALSLSRRAAEGEFEFYVSLWALPELIEASLRTGNENLAAVALERLAESADICETDWARGIFARCQALVINDETAELHYLEAIERLGRTALRPDHARAHLLYGEWLRRQNRRLDARDQLHRAHDMFSEIGMLAFGERALHALQATGETVRKRRDDTRHDLTPQEEQIARLALEGRTNPEIGAQLYISARTVEWHLRKVFTKLGITSRRGLRDALPSRAGRQN
jgi:DNA-binding CsgD family transcriptional regulator